MFSASLLGALWALVASLVWGCGDFSGGLAARRNSQYQVLVLASLVGSLFLLALAILLTESWPSGWEIFWAFLAGISGALGIATLYQGLALGAAAIVSPVAAVVGTAVPVLAGLLSRQPPSGLQLAGFLVAAAGIWLVAHASSRAVSAARRGLSLAFLSGLAFGFFFILIARVGRDSLFSPLVIAKGASLGLALLFLYLRRESILALKGNSLAVLAGILDAGGNAFYLLATHYTRLDVAAVLASLYPAATVLLSSFLIKERISLRQWLGVVLCLAAVILILVG
jgi:drug/metabolite transporter (DMT)-like permease